MKNLILSIPTLLLSTIVMSQTFGVKLESSSVASAEIKMKEAGIKLVRADVYYAEKTHTDIIDKYLQDGFNVQINFNYKSTFNQVAYPTDKKLIRQQAKAFFKYYRKYKKQIPFVVVENEWDNIYYHSGTVQDYLTELSIITEMAHRYGFKIADAGLTSKSLQQYAYESFNPFTDSAFTWLNNYKVKFGGTYTLLKSAIAEYAAGIKNIPIDFLNVHWYNESNCYNGFARATNYYRSVCGKSAIPLITNEFGVRTNKVLAPGVFAATLREIKGNVAYALAYSGTDKPNKANSLINMLNLLQ